jgi:hypothetical protein
VVNLAPRVSRDYRVSFRGAALSVIRQVVNCECARPITARDIADSRNESAGNSVSKQNFGDLWLRQPEVSSKLLRRKSLHSELNAS